MPDSRSFCDLILLFSIALTSQHLAMARQLVQQSTTPQNPQQVATKVIGSFPPEPLLPPLSTAISDLLSSADRFGSKGDYQTGLNIRSQAIDQIRDSNLTDLGFALRGKSWDLFYLKRYDEALDPANQSVAAFTRANDSIGRVGTLFPFAALWLDAGRDAKTADDLLTQALTIARAETLLPGSMYRALRSAGQQVRIGSVKWARTFYSTALELAQKYPEAVEEAGISDYDLAELDFETGELKVAESRLEQNVPLWTKLIESATSHLTDTNRQLQQSNQRDIFVVQGFRTQLADLEGHRAYYRGELGRTYVMLGEIAQTDGRPDVALQRYNTAIQTLNIDRDKVNPVLISEAYQTRGTFRMEQGDLSMAGDDLDEAFNVSVRSTSLLEITRNETELGRLAAQQFKYSSAENFLRVAQENLIYDRRDPRAWAANCLAMGETLTLIGDNGPAKKYLDFALGFYEKQQMPLKVAAAKLIRGTYAVNEKAEQDMKDLTDVRDILSKLAPRSVMMAKVLISIAFKYGEERSRDADPLLKEAGEILKTSAPKSIALAVVDHNLMVPVREAGNLPEAEKLAYQSWDNVRKLANEFAGDEGSENYSSRFANYGGSLAYLQVLQKKNEAAFITLERTRARGLFQLMVQRGDLNKEQWEEHRARVSNKYKSESDFAQATSARLVASRSLETMRRQNAPVAAILQAESRFNAADGESHKAEELLAISTVRADSMWRSLLKNPSTQDAALDLHQLQKSLAPGTLFILFGRDRDYLMVFGVRGGSPDVVVETIDIRTKLNDGVSAKPKSIGDLILDFRQKLDGSPSDQDLDLINKQAETLFTTLFPGRLRSLVLNADRLVISPETILWSLPFAALVSGRSKDQQPQYLGLSKSITYAQSLSLSLRANNAAPYLKPSDAPSAVVVGDPKFDVAAVATPVELQNQDRRETVWAGLRSRKLPPASLQYSRGEATSVSCRFKSQPLLGISATEEELRKEIERVDVIHLASHSVVPDRSAMDSGILLTPPSNDPPAGQTDNDGALQAWEVFSQLQLRAELVVLSACDTALGRSVRGEGIVGLARAFQYAGARSVVATQWKVSDESTNSFMVAFYDALLAGKSKDDALRVAMTTVAANRATANPHHWAAFTLTGASNSNLHAAAIGKCE